MIGVGLSATLAGGRKSRVNLDPMPALDLNFAANRSLPADYGPTPSFSRASTGTYFNSSGVLTSAAVNVPRFNHVYSGGSWVSRGLLIEEQRTNVIPKSNTFSVWQLTDAVITSDNTTAPDGTLNSDLVTFTASGTIPRVVQYGSFNTVSGTAYTKSIYVKSGTQRYFQLVWSGGFGAKYANFDTQDKVAATVSAGVTASVTDCGNGWYRYSATITASGNSSNDQFWIYAVDSGSAGWAPASSSGGTMWLFGAQYEAGAFPSSFIVSDSGSATTRSADVCQITGTSFSSFWNASEGVAAFEGDSYSTLTSDQLAFSFDDNSNSNAFFGSRSISTLVTDFGVGFRSGGSAVATLTSGAGVAPTGSGFKVAAGYKVNDFAASINGAAVLTDTSGAVPSGVSQLLIGRCAWVGAPFTWNGHISRLRYYPTRLTNDQLQSLST